MKSPLIPVSIALVLSATSLFAEVQPNRLFSDGVVFQQGVEIPVWGTAAENEEVTVQFHKQTAKAVAKDGKWMVRLKPETAGGPYELEIEGTNEVIFKNAMVGEVWVCSGQSNMEWKMGALPNYKEEIQQANWPMLRMFTVSRKIAPRGPETVVSGSWVECSPETVPSFSAVGYFFGRDLHKNKGVAVGMICSAWGGTPAQSWTSLSGLEAEPELVGYVQEIQNKLATFDQDAALYPDLQKKYQEEVKLWNENPEVKAWTEQANQARAAGLPNPPQPQTPAQPKAPQPPGGNQNTATVLYNGMIAPLLPYAIKGVIWYQGESNNGKALEYQTLFPRMISDWRQKWGQGEFPFLFVQIAPFNGMSPEIREAQLVSWKKTPSTAMVVTTDVGDAGNIHPKMKEPVGARLALAARALAYGEKIEYSGPVYASHAVRGGKVILSFDHIGGGLVAKDGPLKGFTIAGADAKFVPATSELQGDKVIVSSSEVANPVAVRYGWANVPDVNLFNKEGLPATPFRTDIQHKQP